MPNRQETLYKDFSARLLPRPLWNAQDGTAMRVWDGMGRFMGYQAKPAVKPKSGTRKLTEAEDNALARSGQRRHNRFLRGWLPYARR